MRVKNECRVDFQYQISPTSPVIIKTICSNIVTTDIVKDILKAEKYVDKKYTNPFDILTYTIDIINFSQLLVTNVYFRDRIPTGVRFLENSVSVNNIERRCLDPGVGFYIGNIKANSKARITFKVLVLPQCFINEINNCSRVGFDYVYNVEKYPTRICMNSNNVKTIFCDNVFKQISIENKLHFFKPIINILNTKVKVKILELKLACAPNSDLYLNSKSDLCTLIVIGKIKYEILYKPLIKSKHRNVFFDELYSNTFGFSACMAVPVGVTYLNRNNIKINIEDITTNLIDCNTVYVVTNLLLNY